MQQGSTASRVCFKLCPEADMIQPMPLLWLEPLWRSMMLRLQELDLANQLGKRLPHQLDALE